MKKYLVETEVVDFSTPEVSTFAKELTTSCKNDYDLGKEEGRYQYQELPEFSFEDQAFDLVWSSHFLFLYSEYFDLEFHKKSVLEMLRVAKEVRIFPLLDLNNQISPYLQGVMRFLEHNGYTCKIEKSNYEFQKGANEMLRITNAANR